MNGQQAYAHRARIAHDLSTRQKLALVDVVQILRLPSKDSARQLVARGARMQREQDDAMAHYRTWGDHPGQPQEAQG